MIFSSICEVSNSSFHLARPLQTNASSERTFPGRTGIVWGTPSFPLGCFDTRHLFLPSTHWLRSGEMAFVCSISRRSHVFLGRGKNSVHKVCRTQRFRHRVARRGINHLTGGKKV